MLPAKKILAKPFTSTILRILGQGIFIGLSIGLVVSIFRILLDHSIKLLYVLYPYLSSHPVWILPFIIFTILLCFVVGQIIKPQINNLAGSGIPQLQAMLLDENSMPWFTILWRKFIGTLLALAPGLFLGREGPCIEMGAMIATGYANDFFYTNPPQDTKILQYAGIAAGLSAAVSAPFAGVFFLVEEISSSFKPKEVLTALAAAASADLVTLIFFGNRPVLYLPIAHKLPVSSYWSLVLVGIGAGLLAYSYQWSLLNAKWIFSKLKIIPRQYHSIIPFLLVIPIGLIFPRTLGGSHSLIDILYHNPIIVKQERLGDLTWLLIPIIFFILRFIFSMICYASSLPGGIFMPNLVLGSLLGLIFSTILIHLHLIPSANYTNIIIVSMAAYLGACLHAPFTAIMLLTEIVGTVEQVLPMIMAVFIASVVLSTLGGRPLYASLRKQMGFKV
ncbi:ClC family H(+)/Cl(-) exchange transporter [Lactobacillus sp. PV012]|uniref:ClC family H(+)/Cl(-) exchange transporter n=1 Tax=Lactobacillus sp. PV012 TaxID=2594494 RepID=UPI0022407F2C|nr:ClC family H(+)/Cl(-) exchange transporter [Lactobacillus sp. PV012]